MVCKEFLVLPVQREPVGLINQMATDAVTKHFPVFPFFARNPPDEHSHAPLNRGRLLTS